MAKAPKHCDRCHQLITGYNNYIRRECYVKVDVKRIYCEQCNTQWESMMATFDPNSMGYSACR